jgi:hypothetical protein
VTHKQRRYPEQSAGFYRNVATAMNGRGCRGKVRHAKRKQALTARSQALAANPEDPRPIDVYRCGECRGWHIGHSNRSPN